MDSISIVDSFHTYLDEKDLCERDLSLELFPDLFLDFYHAVKYDEVDEEKGGDLLLFDYKVRNWGFGFFQEINFKRQLYSALLSSRDRVIYNLGVTFFYDPEPFADIKPFDRWTNECRTIDDFRQLICESPGFLMASRKKFVRHEVTITSL